MSYTLSPDNELFKYLEEKKCSRNTNQPQKIVSYPNALVNVATPKILLIFPPMTIPNGMMKRCIPPLGLCYIASSLRQHKFLVSILDSVVEGYDNVSYSKNNDLITYGLSLKEIQARLESEKPDIVGLSVVFSTDLYNLYDVTKIVKEWNPNVPVVVGGLHPSIYPKETMTESIIDNIKGIDFIIRGEGEFRMIDFINNLLNQQIDLNADGLCGWYKNKLFMNPQSSRITDLDALPFPAYDLLPIEKYFNINVPFSPVPKGKRVLPIVSSRGCPIGCNFCANTNMYKKFFGRSPENIIQEIKLLKENYDIDEIQFADDNLTLKKSRAKKFFHLLKSQKIIWCTPNGVMINTIDSEMFDLMVDSGLYQITLSIDSGSAKTLKKAHNKPVKLNKIKGIVDKANELGIFSHGTIVVGMIGETLADIEESLNFVYGLDLTSLSVFIASPIPGSVLYHVAIEKGLIDKKNARKINTTKSTMNLAEINPKELENMVVEFQNKYSEKIKKTNPELLKKKYDHLIDKDPTISQKMKFRLT